MKVADILFVTSQTASLRSILCLTFNKLCFMKVLNILFVTSQFGNQMDNLVTLSNIFTTFSKYLTKYLATKYLATMYREIEVLGARWPSQILFGPPYMDAFWSIFSKNNKNFGLREKDCIFHPILLQNVHIA